MLTALISNQWRVISNLNQELLAVSTWSRSFAPSASRSCPSASATWTRPPIRVRIYFLEVDKWEMRVFEWQSWWWCTVQIGTGMKTMSKGTVLVSISCRLPSNRGGSGDFIQLNWFLCSRCSPSTGRPGEIPVHLPDAQHEQGRHPEQVSLRSQRCGVGWGYYLNIILFYVHTKFEIQPVMGLSQISANTGTMIMGSVQNCTISRNKR